MTLPRIGVTLGDPGGVGPEVAVKCLSRPEALPPAEYVVFGDARVLANEEKKAGLKLGAEEWHGGRPGRAGVFLKEVRVPATPAGAGRLSAENGKASFLFFEAAVAEARSGRLDGLTTAPVSKAAWGLAGLPWRGHTEYLSRDYPRAVMAFWSERLKVALYTHHRPLREAAEAVREAPLGEFLISLHQALAKVPGGPYSLLVAGLNPHAGEDGRLGREDEEEIRPAVERAVRAGVPASGPFSPDTVFLRARGRDKTVAVALYHDQGLIPFKLEAFHSGVNVTLGLPFVRTSPAHGTAYEIAGKGAADPGSMAEALRLAAAFSAGAS